MRVGAVQGVFDVSRPSGACVADSAENPNHRASDGRDNQKQDHHGNRTVLVSVIQRRSKDTVTCYGFSETACFLKMRWFSSRDAFAVSDFATHAPTSGMRVIALAKVDWPEPSFTDAVKFRPWSDTISV